MQLFNLAWYFLLGVSSALDTLASQAYGAADRAGVISWAITAAIVMSIFGVSISRKPDPFCIGCKWS